MPLCHAVRLSFSSAILFAASGAALASAATPGPQGVSPGAPVDFARAVACPTFSWTSLAGAHGYELVVYPVAGETGKPSLEALLPAGATSWSPATDRCLPTGRYGWSVRAVRETDRVRGEWAEALLFEVAAAPTAAELQRAVEVVQRFLGTARVGEQLLGEAMADILPTRAVAAAESSRPQGEGNETQDVPIGGGPATAVRGEVPDAVGETYGVRGVSNSPDGAGVRADNNNVAGADLILGGSPVAELTESGLSRDSVSNLTFDFTNPGAGTMSLQVDGTDVLTTATDLWVDETGDTMTGVLTLVDDLDLGGQLLKEGTLFLHDSGNQNVALGENALFLGTGSFNTAVGTLALSGTTTGFANVAVGAQAMLDNTTGSENTAVGSSALGDTVAGLRNSALGSGALRLNTSGIENVAMGQRALYANTTGGTNVALGTRALDANTTGASNTAVGTDALGANTTSSYNTAVGGGALLANTTGVGNTAVGAGALSANTTGGLNTAVGNAALLASNATGNTAVGTGALDADTSGTSNTALGANALGSNTTGSNNVAVGRDALLMGYGDNNTIVGTRAFDVSIFGGSNTAVGYSALAYATGNFNVAIGARAGFGWTTGSNNIAIGRDAGLTPTAGSDNILIGHAGAAEGNTIRIGTAGTHTTTLIAGISGNTTGLAGVTVLVDANGELGTISSSRRFKEEIQGIGAASERILALRPVAFRYRKEVTGGEQPREYGLVAEEVAEVFPELVVYDDRGRPETVRYHLLTPLLLDQLQRQGRRIEELTERLRRLEGG